MNPPINFRKFVPLLGGKDWREAVLLLHTSDDVFMPDVARRTMQKVGEMHVSGDLALILKVNVKRAGEFSKVSLN